MKLASFDVETSGTLQEYALQPHRVLSNQSWVTSFAFAWRKDDGIASHGQLLPEVSALRAFLVAMKQQGRRIVGWNTPFDVAWLIAMGLREEVMACQWLDAMLLWKHLIARPDFATADGKRQAFGLKEAVRQFIPDAAGYEKDVDFHTADEQGLLNLLHYNKLDCVYTLRLAEQFLSEMPAAMRRNALIEAATIPHAAETMVEGLPVDLLNTIKLHRRLKATRKANYSKLALEEGVTEKVLSSPAQLSALLFDTWGLPAQKETASGAASTDKDVLSELADIDPRAKLVRDYREAGNLDTKFCVGTIKSARYNGLHKGQHVVRPSMRMFGTYTGRMTFSSKQGKGKAERPIGTPLHQWKRGADFRRIVTVPEGYDLVEFDFAGQEFRFMAVMSGDERMLSLCEPGEDAHAYMGARIARMDYDDMRVMLHTDPPDPEAKKNRQYGKLGNLACIAEGQEVLTDRGYVPIESVTTSDRVWDGDEWVTHDGVVYQGDRDVITYQGITATADHRVLVDGAWKELGEVALNGWHIRTAVGGTGAARRYVRIVDGVIRRAIGEARLALRESALHVRRRKGRAAARHGGWEVYSLQAMRNGGCAQGRRLPDSGHPGEAAAPVASGEHDTALHEPSRESLRVLRRAWHRVSVRVSESVCRLHPRDDAEGGLQRPGYRPHQQRWALRARKPAAGDARREHAEQATKTKVRTYDILNAGPRHRFVVGNCVVSNCQYRTSANTLRIRARTDYQIKLTPIEAKAIHATYQLTYRRVPEYWIKQIAKAQRLGYVETLAGRRVQLGFDWPSKLKWSYESTSINFPIQGVGADQKYLAIMVAGNYLPKVGGRVAFELHDGLFFYIPKAHSQRAVHELRAILSNLPYEKAWGVSLPIAFPVDAKIGHSWGDLKEVHD